MATKSLHFYTVDTHNKLRVPFVGGVKAGFPSPAQDYVEASIDLNKELIAHPSATFLARVVGDSLQGAGLNEGDLILVDKSAPYAHGKMAICFIDGDFTAKYLNLNEKDKGVIWLHAANDAYQPIRVTAENDFLIWGMVIEIIKKPPVMKF